MFFSNSFVSIITVAGIAGMCCTACGDESADSSGLQRQAAAKLRQCGVMEGFTPAAGVPSAGDGDFEVLARWVLDQPCNTLSIAFSQAHKADQTGLARFACLLGFGQFCSSARCDLPPLPPQMSSCRPLIDDEGCDSCQYYKCVESLPGRACGEQGYYLGYVAKYCEIFTKWTRPRLSPQGQQWIDDVRRCLMLSLEDSGIAPTTSCDEVRKLGFAAHPTCYLQTGICQLPPRDWAMIVSTIAPWDSDLLQMIKTGAGCLLSLGN